MSDANSIIGRIARCDWANKETCLLAAEVVLITLIWNHRLFLDQGFRSLDDLLITI